MNLPILIGFLALVGVVSVALATRVRTVLTGWLIVDRRRFRHGIDSVRELEEATT